MSIYDGVSRGESVRDRCHRQMSHALHSDSYEPQLYISAGCSGEVMRPSGQFLQWQRSKTALDE